MRSRATIVLAATSVILCAGALAPIHAFAEESDGGPIVVDLDTRDGDASIKASGSGFGVEATARGFGVGSYGIEIGGRGFGVGSYGIDVTEEDGASLTANDTEITIPFP